jgi:hypothetical protein
MKRGTKHPITSKAVYFMALKAEEWIIETVKAATALMEQRNRLRKQNGLEEKVRITDEVLSEVLKYPQNHIGYADEKSAGGVDNEGHDPPLDNTPFERDGEGDSRKNSWRLSARARR